jgi:hypothetical protein
MARLKIWIYSIKATLVMIADQTDIIIRKVFQVRNALKRIRVCVGKAAVQAIVGNSTDQGVGRASRAKHILGAQNTLRLSKAGSILADISGRTQLVVLPHF